MTGFGTLVYVTAQYYARVEVGPTCKNGSNRGSLSSVTLRRLGVLQRIHFQYTELRQHIGHSPSPSGQCERKSRPFAALLASILRPFTLRLRTRKPCLRLRFRCDGWYSWPFVLCRTWTSGEKTEGRLRPSVKRETSELSGSRDDDAMEGGRTGLSGVNEEDQEGDEVAARGMTVLAGRVGGRERRRASEGGMRGMTDFCSHCKFWCALNNVARILTVTVRRTAALLSRPAGVVDERKKWKRRTQRTQRDHRHRSVRIVQRPPGSACDGLIGTRYEPQRSCSFSLAARPFSPPPVHENAAHAVR